MRARSSLSAVSMCSLVHRSGVVGGVQVRRTPLSLTQRLFLHTSPHRLTSVKFVSGAELKNVPGRVSIMEAHKKAKPSDYYVPDQIKRRRTDPSDCYFDPTDMRIFEKGGETAATTTKSATSDASEQSRTPSEAELSGAAATAYTTRNNLASWFQPTRQNPRLTPTTPISATAAAAASATDATPEKDESELAAEAGPMQGEVVWLYRVMLRHARALQGDRRAEVVRETRREFRAHRSEQDEKRARKHLDSAYSKLSFLRMSMPRIDHPRLGGPIPSYPSAQAVLGGGGKSETGSTSYTYFSGEVISSHVRARQSQTGRRVVNSQGITNEQMERHRALNERMSFRGPFWQGKPRGTPLWEQPIPNFTSETETY